MSQKVCIHLHNGLIFSPSQFLADDIPVLTSSQMVKLLQHRRIVHLSHPPVAPPPLTHPLHPLTLGPQRRPQDSDYHCH